MSDEDMVQLSGRIVVDYSVLVDQEEYEEWANGKVTDVPDMLWQAQKEALREHSVTTEGTLTEAWLVDEEEHRIARLKEFK